MLNQNNWNSQEHFEGVQWDFSKECYKRDRFSVRFFRLSLSSLSASKSTSCLYMFAIASGEMLFVSDPCKATHLKQAFQRHRFPQDLPCFSQCHPHWVHSLQRPRGTQALQMLVHCSSNQNPSQFWHVLTHIQRWITMERSTIFNG